MESYSLVYFYSTYYLHSTEDKLDQSQVITEIRINMH